MFYFILLSSNYYQIDTSEKEIFLLKFIDDMIKRKQDFNKLLNIIKKQSALSDTFLLQYLTILPVIEADVKN